MSNFLECWNIQKEFTNRVVSYSIGKSLNELSDEEKISLTKDYVLKLHGEVDEILRSLPWKDHRVETKGISRQNLVIELIDVQKFLWGLADIWGVTSEEFQQIFEDKSLVVEHRWVQEIENKCFEILKRHDKIAVVDIDGVLNTYPQCFYDWVESYTGKFFGPVLAEEFRKNNPIQWEKWKHEYRLSGVKSKLPIRKNSKELLELLSNRGYFVVLATNRPVDQYNGIMLDTIYWLINNSLYFDYIYWANLEDKILFFQDILSRISLVLDDSEEVCNQFRAYNVNAIQIKSDKDLEEVIKII